VLGGGPPDVGPVRRKEERLDLYKAGRVSLGETSSLPGSTQNGCPPADLAMVNVFILGYAGIIRREELALNKAGSPWSWLSLCGHSIAGW
jgi:hypothetical protein